jgi:molybdenum cofactor cytidylyltransferase
VLGDQPHLRPVTLRTLLEFAANRPESVCQPACDGRRRHPVLLPRAVFGELSNSKAANLQDFIATCESAAFGSDDPGLDLDIDQPEDYQRALALAAKTPGP